MIDKKTIENLANLCRIEISEEEKEKITSDLGSILEYVSELKTAPIEETSDRDTHINILRDDDEPHDPGVYTEKIMDCVPNKKEGYVVVKQIMAEKKK